MPSGNDTNPSRVQTVTAFTLDFVIATSATVWFSSFLLFAHLAVLGVNLPWQELVPELVFVSIFSAILFYAGSVAGGASALRQIGASEHDGIARLRDGAYVLAFSMMLFVVAAATINNAPGVDPAMGLDVLERVMASTCLLGGASGLARCCLSPQFSSNPVPVRDQRDPRRDREQDITHFSLNHEQSPELLALLSNMIRGYMTSTSRPPMPRGSRLTVGESDPEVQIRTPTLGGPGST
jgi:hypothetical protein